MGLIARIDDSSFDGVREETRLGTDRVEKKHWPGRGDGQSVTHCDETCICGDESVLDRTVEACHL